MKFITALATFAGVAMAQNAAVGVPKEHAELKAGSEAVVQIERPVCEIAYLSFFFFSAFKIS